MLTRIFQIASPSPPTVAPTRVEESNGPDVAALLRDSLLFDESAELARELSAESLVVPSEVFETLVLTSAVASLPSLLPAELDWLEFESLDWPELD